MTDLTTDQQSDFRADLGVPDDQTVFTDAALNRLYARAAEDYNLAVSYGYRQLAAGYATEHDYQAGLTQEKRSQIFDHLNAMAQYYFDLSSAGDQVRIVGIRRVPPPRKARPSGQLHPDVKGMATSDPRYRRILDSWWWW
jgi:hypothetical protein